VGCDALDDHKAARSPSVRRATQAMARCNASGGDGKWLGDDELPGSGTQDGDGVRTGVGVDTHDIGMSMRNDGQGERLPSRHGIAIRPPSGRRRPGWKPLRGSTVMSHDPPYGGETHSSDQVTEVEPVGAGHPSRVGQVGLKASLGSYAYQESRPRTRRPPPTLPANPRQLPQNSQRTSA
jgi:hypothetical protein